MSTGELLSAVPTALTEQEMDTETSLHPTKSHFPVSHLYLKVPLAVTTGSGRDSVKSFGLHTTLVSSQLGLGGWYHILFFHLNYFVWFELAAA